VLCATSSFWQGVDVPGDALRAVLIDKLPFQVPTEPVVAARLSRLEEQGENSFLRYSVPAAIIALRQGLGRLIRSREDRGVLGVFDSRLRTRHYGFLFTRSLPSFPIVDKIDAIRISANEWWPPGQDREDPASKGPRLRKADS
jgi:ATP-dependent DNA helicase DinG